MIRLWESTGKEKNNKPRLEKVIKRGRGRRQYNYWEKSMEEVWPSQNTATRKEGFEKMYEYPLMRPCNSGEHCNEGGTLGQTV